MKKGWGFLDPTRFLLCAASFFTRQVLSSHARDLYVSFYMLSINMMSSIYSSRFWSIPLINLTQTPGSGRPQCISSVKCRDQQKTGTFFVPQCNQFVTNTKKDVFLKCLSCFKLNGFYIEIRYWSCYEKKKINWKKHSHFRRVECYIEFESTEITYFNNKNGFSTPRMG